MVPRTALLAGCWPGWGPGRSQLATYTGSTHGQDPRRLVTPVRRLVQLLLVAFVVIYFVLPQIAGARRALSLLGGVNLWLIVLGVALEATSILCYANLTRAMIHGTPPPT